MWGQQTYGHTHRESQNWLVKINKKPNEATGSKVGYPKLKKPKKANDSNGWQQNFSTTTQIALQGFSDIGVTSNTMELRL